MTYKRLDLFFFLSSLLLSFKKIFHSLIPPDRQIVRSGLISAISADYLISPHLVSIDRVLLLLSSFAVSLLLLHHPQ